MFRATMMVVGLLALAAFGLSGCSDDETPITPVDPGISDASYPVVKAEFDNALDSTASLFESGIDLASEINTGELGNLDDILFGPMLVDSQFNQNTWHVLFGTTIAAGVSRTIIDSVQFTRDGVPQANPQDANGLTLRHVVIQTNDNTTGTYRNIESYTAIELTGLDGDAAVINGSHNAVVTTQIVAGGTTTVREWTVTSEINGVTIARTAGWTNGCPTTGTVTTDIGLAQTVNGGTPVETSWQFTVDFENGIASVTATLGNETATYTRTICQM